MKRLTGTVLTALLSMTMLGCSKNNPTVSSTTHSGSADVDPSTTEHINQPANNVGGVSSSDADLPNTYKVPMHDIYVDAPAYQEIEEAYTELFIVHEQKYVAFTSDVDVTVNTPKEAHEDVFPIFQLGLVNYEGGVNSISITSDKEVTVNGIDTYYFEGTINYGKDNIHDGYAVGYAFIMDGVPCEIIGSVIDDEQSADTIKEIKDYVDAMMESVRTTE